MVMESIEGEILGGTREEGGQPWWTTSENGL